MKEMAWRTLVRNISFSVLTARSHLSLFQKAVSNYRFCTCYTQYAEMRSDQMPTHSAHHFRITLEQQFAIFM